MSAANQVHDQTYRQDVVESDRVVRFARDMPEIAPVDVLVIGGGSAGIAATVAAARNGARTLLVERSGMLGGTSTGALVGPFMTSFDANGERPVVGGIFRDIVERMAALGGAIIPDQVPGDSKYSSFIALGHANVTPFNADVLKIVAADMVLESGAKLLLHSDFIDSERQGRTVGPVIIKRKEGLAAVRAQWVIDCSADGDVAAAAGAPFVLGDGQGKMQPATLFLRIGNVDEGRVAAWVAESRASGRQERLFESIVKAAREQDRFPIPREYINIYEEPQAGVYRVNVTRVLGVDGTKSEDLTRAEIEGRKQILALMDFFKAHCPGLEDVQLLEVATRIGIRETRHILGDYVLSGDDVLNGARFDDAIARYAYPVDIHDTDGTLGRLEGIRSDYYEIPVRCLLAREHANLLVAGRCISADHVAHGSVRVIPACYATGEAAGTLAALASGRGLDDVRKLPASELREVLRAQGAIV